VSAFTPKSIAIVGAGPSGAAAGYHLARCGHDVTLIDRAEFPRDKVCGDWITPAALAELAALGLDAERLRDVAPGMTSISRGALVAPGGGCSQAPIDAAAACIRRYALDAAVRARALDAGCTPMRIDIRRGALDALADRHGLVIDARGAHAGAANAVGLRAYWTLPRAAVSRDELDAVTLLTDARFGRGYGWIFPADEDDEVARFNVGVGLLRADGRPGANVSTFYTRFTTTHPALAALSARARVREEPVGCHVGLGRWRIGVAQGRTLRIGDAANLADPLTGDGIGNALRSGRLVADAIHHAIDADDAARRWQRECMRAFATELRVALLLRAVLAPTLAKNAAATMLAHSGAWRERLHGALFGVKRYRDLLR
jgi:flavin-dependent dehydrogenase